MARPTRISETQLQAAIVEAARLLGWAVAHFRPARTNKGWRTATAYDAHGYPDLTLVRERVLFAELKGDHGRFEPEQARWRVRLQLAGCEYYLWRPDDWLEGRVDETLRLYQHPDVCHCSMWPVPHHHLQKGDPDVKQPDQTSDADTA